MRPRKILIMLAIAAVSTLTLFVISLMTSTAKAAPLPTTPTVVMSAVPDTLLGYEEKVIVGSDGNAQVEITVIVGRRGLSDLLLPFGFDDTTNFSILSGPASIPQDDQGLPEPTPTILGRPMLHLEVAGTAVRGDTIRVAASAPNWFSAEDSSLPYGEFLMDRHFVNTSTYVLQDVRMSVVLPEGMLVHSIEKVVPAYSPKKNPQPPFKVARLGNRGMATLAVAQMEPTNAIRLSVNVRPSQRGLIPLFGGLIMAGLYLFFFRDVLKPPKEA